jgi:hypothetical protein
VNSVVPPPPNQNTRKSAFNRSEFEVFAHHTSGASGDSHGDRLLEWATNPKFKKDRIRFTRMRTMGKKAVDLNMPGGVMSRDFTEPEDGPQRLVFFYRSLYDAIKQLISSSRFKGKQYTQFELVYSSGQKRKYGAINRGSMYEIAQGYAGPDASPVPAFLSSDTTVICKKMGAHPIICEYTFLYMHVYALYVYVFTLYVYVCVCIMLSVVRKCIKYEMLYAYVCACM